jgi:hypothetical protein
MYLLNSKAEIPEATRGIPVLPGDAGDGQRREGQPVLVSVLLVRSGGGALLRTGCLTPYVTEIITQDALRAGNGARLVVTVLGDTDDMGVARLTQRFARFRERGVDVSVVREGEPAGRFIARAVAGAPGPVGSPARGSRAV